MSESSEKDIPIGEWFHSHEEDVGNRMIFRKSGFDFPLSRGRIGFRLEKGGSAETISIGSDDRPVKAGAHWHVQGAKEIIIDGDEFSGLLTNSTLTLSDTDKIVLQRNVDANQDD